MKRRKFEHIWGTLIFLLAFGSAFIAGYIITAQIFRLTGPPSELLRHFFSGMTALIIVIVVGQLFMHISGNPRRKNHREIHDQLTGALAQMARGDFNILINPKSIGEFNELAEAINDMAQSLGTLETMRQDFISNVSHEIQSPLTSISGFAALLQKETLPDDERRRYAAIIEAESKRLSSLSDSLLKLSSLDNNKTAVGKKEFRLDKQLEGIALMLEPQWADKNLIMEADLQKLTTSGDEDLLSQVWVNLLHNAIKFTPEGGRIAITLTTENNSFVVKISDTGPGIEPAAQVHIFERFYKVDKARDRSLGGNGLGLSIVKKIVDMCGGTVSVDSTPNKGTTFQVILPLS